MKMLLRMFWIGKILIIYFIIYILHFFCLLVGSQVSEHIYIFIVYRHFFCLSKHLLEHIHIFYDLSSLFLP